MTPSLAPLDTSPRATIRRRSWTSPDGRERTAWQATLTAADGRRRARQFPSKRAAEDWLTQARHEVARGTFTPESGSPKLNSAIDQWLARAAAEKLERSTLASYCRLAGHVRALMPDNPKLVRITQARVEALRDGALHTHSRAMARKILAALQSILKDARRRGQISVNVAAETTIGPGKRHKGRLQVGVDVPFPSEIQAMLDAAGPKARAAVALAARAGLRASELRGLAWSSVDLGNRPSVAVVQRADQWAELGSPKSESSHRTVPLSSATAQALREWRIAQPAGRSLVFATSSDKPDMLTNLRLRLLWPLCDAAKVRRYGWHSLRHHAISSWLAAGIDVKSAQVWAGHSSAMVTVNVYGHFVPRSDDHARIEAAEKALLG